MIGADPAFVRATDDCSGGGEESLPLRRSPRFEVHRQGLDVDVVALAT